MKKSLTFVLLLFSFLSFSKIHDWKKVDEEKGVKIFEKKMPGSSILAFRGTAIVNASLGKIYYVLQDYKNEREWVDMLDKNIILKNFSKDERVQYQSFDLPWPISDRDFVYHAKSSLSKSGKKILMIIKSVDYEGAPKTVGVRGSLYRSSFELEKIAPNKTKVDVQIYADPKGFLPKWVVNLIQKGWPLDTLEGIRRQVLKSYTGELLPGQAH
ncbi:MAG: START domain-containing protein [Bdellovibrionota bacterium]|nr:START domain-containing protein [Bdellovibrionota bacterium]